MNEEQLNPCPKCRGKELSIWREHNNQCYNISCVSCSYTLECMESIYYSIKKWNLNCYVIEAENIMEEHARDMRELDTYDKLYDNTKV